MRCVITHSFDAEPWNGCASIRSLPDAQTWNTELYALLRRQLDQSALRHADRGDATGDPDGMPSTTGWPYDTAHRWTKRDRHRYYRQPQSRPLAAAKIVLAPDSFQGSLSARRVCAAVESGLRRVLPDARSSSVPWQTAARARWTPC